MGVFENKSDAPSFGAACDGDADRNMILGKNFFVNFFLKFLNQAGLSGFGEKAFIVVCFELFVYGTAFVFADFLAPSFLFSKYL